MSISFSSYQNLVNYINDRPIIHILNNDGSHLSTDIYKDIENYTPSPLHVFQYKQPLEKIREIRIEFELELKTNRFLKEFNFDTFCQTVDQEFKELKEKFKKIKIRENQISIRNDFLLSYRCDTKDIIEVDPISLILDYPEVDFTQDDFDKLSDFQLNEISTYFNSYENIIDEILITVKGSSTRNKREYNSAYPYDFFKFKSAKIGYRLPKNKCIESFFNALIGIYIEGEDSLIHLHKYFNDKKSTSRVIWKNNGASLYYLIKTISDQGYIEDAMGSITNIIPKIFVKKDGSEFSANELHSRRPSQKVIKELNKIILLLKQ